MKDKIEDGGPAFPHQDWDPAIQAQRRENGMTLRQYAAIHLKVPHSGLPWLDEMINEARRDAFAGQALQGVLSSTSLSDLVDMRRRDVPKQISDRVIEITDAMIEAGRVK
jgi:hypothetical protein